MFSTVVFVKHSQYLPDTKVITLIQSPAGPVRADIDHFSFLSAPEGLVLLDSKSRTAVRVKGGKYADVFHSLTGVSLRSTARFVSSKVTGYTEHLGYRCRIVQIELEEEGIRSRRIEWIARIGNKDTVLRRVERSSQGWYVVQEAYQVTRGAAEKWLTIPSDYSVWEAESVTAALQTLITLGE